VVGVVAVRDAIDAVGYPPAARVQRGSGGWQSVIQIAARALDLSGRGERGALIGEDHVPLVAADRVSVVQVVLGRERVGAARSRGRGRHGAKRNIAGAAAANRCAR
jgi:hypothetical protein